jgi:tol-pal system protein YbgF
VSEYRKEHSMRLTLLALSVAALAVGCASTPPEADPVQLKLNDLDARITRIERIVANQVEVAQRLDEVQGAVRQLRGRLEELEHGNEALAKQQRDLYADLDKRLAAASGAAGAGAAAGGAASATGEPAAPGGATSPGAAPGAAAGNAPSSVEQAVYTQAFDALKAGSYSVAITGFKDFLGTYPASALAENAQYWLGEAYYVNHDYEAAAAAFRAVLKRWPDSRKAPDALLKLGYTQYALKQYSAARATLNEVTQKYPGSESAKLAADRLRRVPTSPSQ